MKLTRITLKNYRNIAQMELSPCDTVNVIYGDNGQGKTNLLESIYLLTGNPSFRGAKLSEVIRFSQKQSQITALFSDQEREQKLSIKLGAKKEILLNQVPLKKYSELAGQFYCVVFSPEDLDFVKGSPKNRRRFLDSAICQITPQYMGYLEQYDHVLEQRNALLKELNRSPYWKDTLDIWDLQLAKLGTILSIYRKDYLAKLGRVSSVIYDGLSSQRERFSLRYLSSGFDSMEEITSYEDEIIKDYLQKLQSFLEQDIRCGFTNVGIHRDDIDLLVNDLPAKTYGSQGQTAEKLYSGFKTCGGVAALSGHRRKAGDSVGRCDERIGCWPARICIKPCEGPAGFYYLLRCDSYHSFEGGENLPGRGRFPYGGESVFSSGIGDRKGE